MKHFSINNSLIIFLTSLTLVACRQEKQVLQPNETLVTDPISCRQIKGFYLLNEGNMGSNKATLDYFDYQRGVYTQNLYASVNPDVVAELGDVGNDLQIYGGKMYAIINCSNLVEVMDARSAKHLKIIEIPNARYVAFYRDKAYVSSYAGPVQLHPAHEQLGFVAEIDTTTLQVTRKVLVGYQPEEMAVVGRKLYVANSGGYYPPRYDNRVSVIDLESFVLQKQIEVAINIHRVRSDRNGRLYVSCRGDYYDRPSNLYVIDTQNDVLLDSLNIPTSDFCISGDSLYSYCADWDANTGQQHTSYTLYDIARQTIVSNRFIDESIEIKVPYGIAINPETHEIFLCDAKNYVSPGTLYCFAPNGRLKWKATTGDIPGHIAFLPF